MAVVLENATVIELHFGKLNCSLTNETMCPVYGGVRVYKSHPQIKISILRFSLSFETIGQQPATAVQKQYAQSSQRNIDLMSRRKVERNFFP
jgi:hypothetical protein